VRSRQRQHPRPRPARSRRSSPRLRREPWRPSATTACPRP
jgi:hypothetical protein